MQNCIVEALFSYLGSFQGMKEVGISVTKNVPNMAHVPCTLNHSVENIYRISQIGVCHK